MATAGGEGDESFDQAAEYAAKVLTYVLERQSDVNSELESESGSCKSAAASVRVSRFVEMYCENDGADSGTAPESPVQSDEERGHIPAGRTNRADAQKGEAAEGPRKGSPSTCALLLTHPKVQKALSGCG